ncbi:MAG: MerR family transcriptional regulator [Proteobacteria bacterium]|nr:MerR family transcriptional regulator [Pseudomonadota bacterium]
MGAHIRYEEPMYSIGTSARLLGVSVHTLRKYEREGLIIPFRKRSHQRLFSDADIERVRCIRQAITEQKISIEGIKHLESLIPCWKLLPCSEKDRRACPAYNDFQGPCWLSRHTDTTCGDRDCRNCHVYKEYFTCSSLKKKLKELI